MPRTVPTAPEANSSATASVVTVPGRLQPPDRFGVAMVEVDGEEQVPLGRGGEKRLLPGDLTPHHGGVLQAVESAEPGFPGVLIHQQEVFRPAGVLDAPLAEAVEQHLAPAGQVTPETRGWRHSRNYVELIIVDESECLRPTALELLRDRYDRDNIALILIGMPGLEKQFSHYPQFYSRVGFAHQYRPLGKDELLFVLQRHWRALGKTLDPEDFTDAQAIAAIARITRGNFRLLERLFPQVERVLRINELDTITNDVIEAAASTLVIGVS